MAPQVSASRLISACISLHVSRQSSIHTQTAIVTNPPPRPTSSLPSKTSPVSSKTPAACPTRQTSSLSARLSRPNSSHPRPSTSRSRPAPSQSQTTPSCSSPPQPLAPSAVTASLAPTRARSSHPAPSMASKPTLCPVLKTSSPNLAWLRFPA